ncbi:hypothetical protein IIV22A_172R [Invertebrate iridescent virus 22]|uniref:Uncharacterized protein n=1 Tax=Invertebrate iridescent virus 22 TaxID=345198 RepID=W8W210_9VIRU|nr:hypothetical protein IIV22A_172R [Invertebrate iridescent virus 22]CCV02016.1 hypothetical protein IIV22A_172R [Invertebrate iridescent virus 22]
MKRSLKIYKKSNGLTMVKPTKMSFSRRCDVKKERKVKNKQKKQYQQFVYILNLRWNIMDSLSLDDHINLAETMKDDYILLLLSRPSQRKLLNDVLTSINLSILKTSTLKCLSKSTWKQISLYSDMSEDFIIKWSHKLDFFRLKVNESGGIYGGWAFSPRFDFEPRNFSKKFHTLFPGYQKYKPCFRCFDDTQWLVKTTYIKDEKKWYCRECWFQVCWYCLDEDCKGECNWYDDWYDYDWYDYY